MNDSRLRWANDASSKDNDDKWMKMIIVLMIMMMMCSSSNDQWMKWLMIKKHAINEDNDNEWFEIKMSKWCQQQRQWW